MVELKVGDRVKVEDVYGNQHKGIVYNINNCRPDNMRYAIDLDEYKDDLVFVSLEQLTKDE